MLNPSECFAASISAAKEMTLVLPRADHEHRCLIIMIEGKPVAVCIDNVHQLGRFFAFPCGENDTWSGLHISGVQIELDVSSLHDADGKYAPKGSMVRVEDKLAIRAQFEGLSNPWGTTLTILEGLPACAPHKSACFLKWQLVLGKGDHKRVLLAVDATPPVS